MIYCSLRFYEELNDFLAPDRRFVTFHYAVMPKTAIKDVIEAVGIPHTEVDLIIVNHQSVNFHYRVQDHDYISVYPVFEALDITNITHLRPKPLRKTQFILDVHLGKLAKYLRLLGFDTLYKNHLTDAVIAEISYVEKRIVLTRDIGLLKNKKITHGHWMRNTLLDAQVKEVLKHFDLSQQCQPFIRCMECNGMLETIEKALIAENLPPMTIKYYQHFMRCLQCKRIYWKGTHYKKLQDWIKKILC